MIFKTVDVFTQASETLTNIERLTGLNIIGKLNVVNQLSCKDLITGTNKINWH
jgi:hypothetical protein